MVKVAQQKRHGLEVWVILINGHVKHTFMSEMYARNRAAQLEKEIGKCSTSM